ncbi:MAG: hypothetical protein ACI810_002178, partial [Gammaproteobacteria bacterium]
RTAAQLNNWKAVTYGNDLFVAVAGSGSHRVMTSTNGINWMAQTAAALNDWRSVTYGNGQFVAISSDETNSVMTSPDAITWTALDAAEQHAWNSVTYGNGQFAAVALRGFPIDLTDNLAMTASADDIATVTLSSNATNHADANGVSNVTFGFTDSAFLSGSAGHITNATGPASSHRGIDFNDAPSLVYGGAGFTENPAGDGSVSGEITATLLADQFTGSSLTVGDNVMLGNVPPGLTASITTKPGELDWAPRLAATANNWRSVTYGNGLFVAVANTGGNRVMTSPDGAVWTARTQPGVDIWQAVTYGNGLFVAVASSGEKQVMTSPDGVTWTRRDAAEPESNKSWQSVAYGNGLFSAVANGGSKRLMTSPDGINWTINATGYQSS